MAYLYLYVKITLGIGICINLNLRFFYIDPHKILPMGAHEHSDFLSHIIVDVDLLKSHIRSYRLRDR